RDTNLMRLAVQQNTKGVGRDFNCVSVQGISVQRNPPEAILSREVDDASFSGKYDLVLHGRRSNCRRRPSRFQADSGAGLSGEVRRTVLRSLPESCGDGSGVYTVGVDLSGRPRPAQDFIQPLGVNLSTKKIGLGKDAAKKGGVGLDAGGGIFLKRAAEACDGF